MEIAELRTQIDALDAELVALLNRRAALVVQIGEVKRREQRPVVELSREHEVYARASALNRGPLEDAELKRIFERVIDVMRNIQSSRMGVAGERTNSPARGQGA